MPTSSDDYIGFRTNAQEAQQQREELLQALKAEEVQWDNLAPTYLKASQKSVDLMLKASERMSQTTDPQDAATLLLLLTVAEGSSTTELIGVMIAKLGAELLRVHQRLAAVEKELQDLRAGQGK